MGNETSETFKKALGLMIGIANQVAMGKAYNQKEYWLDRAFSNAKEDYSAAFWHEVFNLPEEEKRMLGFGKWSADSKGMLIPIWVFECIPDDFDLEVTSIMGDTRQLKDVTDTDTRFGCLCYMA